MEGVAKMKRMTNGAMRCVGVATVLVAGLVLPGNAQEPVRRITAGQFVVCPQGLEQGSLGIIGLDCVGECTLTIKGEGKERTWFFSSEPKILGVDPTGPAHGILQGGDFLVAIDGVLITSREGGRRYANLVPGEEVDVRYRRGRAGRVQEAKILVASDCLDAPLPPVGVVARVVPPGIPLVADSVLVHADSVRMAAAVAVAPNIAIGVAPQVRVAPEAVVVRVDTASPVPLAGVLSVAPNVSGLFGEVTPTGRLGIGFSCTECGTRTDEETGESVWFFSGALEVTAVNRGGPADDAGIERGDLIKAVEGHPIDSDEGGRAFTDITPGEEVRLTVVKRNGREVELTVIPEEKAPSNILLWGGAVAAPDAPAVAGVAVEPDPPTRAFRGGVRVVPDTVLVAEPVTLPFSDVPMVALPLRWTGSLEGVEVEVRGEPVRISEMRAARTIVINTDGLWIRIRIPPGGGEPEVEPLTIR
jgi:S1-C subfamily serine protease